jgi:purine-binding chemotaxis protein CheW
MSTAAEALNTEVTQAHAAGAGSNQYLTFMLAGEEYGVDILRVQEIKGWETPTRIPNTPEYIQGVINLRGTIVPIVGLRGRFALEKMAHGPTTVVIVLIVEAESRERTVGVVVDAVSDVYDVSGAEMKPPPNFGSVINIEFVRGLATVDEKILIILDVDKLLGFKELEELDAISARAEQGDVGVKPERAGEQPD